MYILSIIKKYISAQTWYVKILQFLGFYMILVEFFILHILPKGYMSTPYINGMNCN